MSLKDFSLEQMMNVKHPNRLFPEGDDQEGDLAGFQDLGRFDGMPLAAFGDTLPRPFVLISHMHIDHMGGLGMLSEDADVYMTEESLLLYRGLVKADGVLFRPHRKIFGVAPMDSGVTPGSKSR